MVKLLVLVMTMKESEPSKWLEVVLRVTIFVADTVLGFSTLWRV